MKCQENCNKCYPTRNHDPASKDIMVNKPITCIKCEEGFSLTSPDTCTANEDISTKIDIINYYYWIQPPTLVFVFSHMFPLESQNNTMALSFLGGL